MPSFMEQLAEADRIEAQGVARANEIRSHVAAEAARRAAMPDADLRATATALAMVRGATAGFLAEAAQFAHDPEAMWAQDEHKYAMRATRGAVEMGLVDPL
jgi:hypothetical protein